MRVGNLRVFEDIRIKNELQDENGANGITVSQLKSDSTQISNNTGNIASNTSDISTNTNNIN